MELAKLAYRVSEAVEASGIGRTTLYRLIADGEIAAVHVGRRTLILRESLASYLEQLRSVQTTGGADLGE